LSICQLPVVKLLEVLAHYASTGKETFSPFIDSSIDNVLLRKWRHRLNTVSVY